MQITITYEKTNLQNNAYDEIIERVCQEAALVYGLGPQAEISILLCQNEYIHVK